MKYSELINFQPIESTIQLVEAGKQEEAQKLVETYVMSKKMAETLKLPMIEQLQMDEVVDNKGVLVVGNYGTGKSHLMSVISSVATNADNLKYLQNQEFANSMKSIAGKFEVLRIEIGGVTMSLRDILFGYIQDDFDARGIVYESPDFSAVKDNKKIIKDMMIAFSSKYQDKGYLIVVDEFLSYLTSRDERSIVLDLEFLRALGEMCSKSKLRVVFGVQEKIFDNPKFSFVSETLKKVSDRFTQVVITKESTSYVVSERILKKTPEQKAMIRKHLERFSNLYTGMSSKMDEFVELFPIHPSYIDVFNKVYLIENRHILKNISSAIKEIFDTDVPQNAPGIISFDDYWKAIKANGMLRSDPTISRVLTASGQLEEIINRAFPKPAYKSLALKIVNALSVHRLTTNGLDVHFGLSAENLKDDLCLFLQMPEQDADFLLSLVNTTMKDIMTTVSGQFIIFNEANNQYYIDVDKIVDYDEKIKQKASVLALSDLNRYFYDVVYKCLEWETKEYITNFRIYEYDLNWDSHNIFREGYLFMGLPGERSTAQPERDFYIHIMPPYDTNHEIASHLEDEVYFYFKQTDDFKELLSLYTASNSLADISEGKDKDAYINKATFLRKKLIKYLGENKNTCFEVEYKKHKQQLIAYLKGRYSKDQTFKDTIDLVASICFDDYFNGKYIDFPVMQTKITRKNMADNARAAFDHFAGRKTQQSMNMLKSFGVLDGEKIKPENSMYASYYIEMLKKLQNQEVINYSDIFDIRFMGSYRDKKFRIEYIFTPIIFLSLVYAGYAVLTLKDGTVISASSLEKVPKIGVLDLYEFKYVSKPAQMAMAELKQLFEVIGINPTLVDNPNERENGVEQLIKKAQELTNNAVLSERKLVDGFELWGENLANQQQVMLMSNACSAIKNEFSNYSAKFNTPAKLNNFNLTSEQIVELGKNITLVNLTPKYIAFKSACADTVSYVSNIEYMDLGNVFKSDVENAKAEFRSLRDDIFDGLDGDSAAQKVIAILDKIKDCYIDKYFEEHKKKRLDITEAKRRGTLQESLTLANLRKLRSIEILSSAKLAELEQDMAGLKVCYELTPTTMKSNVICPHCRFSLEDKAKNVLGQLDSIEIRIDDLLSEWAKMLLDTISDPLVLSQKQFLNKEQAKTIDEFISTSILPKKVDDFFVKSINSLLKGFEPVIIKTEDLMQKLDELPPCDIDTFKTKINEIVSDYVKGKDVSKLRIVVKRKESEE